MSGEGPPAGEGGGDGRGGFGRGRTYCTVLLEGSE